MPKVEELQKAHEAEIDRVVAGLAGRGSDSDLALVRALVHRAVHLAAARKSVEFCALATIFAEMTTHAHDLLHPGGRSSPAHSGDVH